MQKKKQYEMGQYKTSAKPEIKSAQKSVQNKKINRYNFKSKLV